MQTFTDNAGNAWQVSVTVDTIKRVRQSLDVNLIEAVEGGLLEKLAADPALLCDVLFVVCQEQATAKGVSDVAFGRALAGDAIEQATNAFLEALVDFFPSRRRAVLSKALGKLKALDSRVLEAAMGRLDSPAMDRLVDKAMADLDAEMAAMLNPSTAPAGNSAASSASIPAG